MSCIAIAIPPLPPFPPGITIPLFVPPPVPNLKLCCTIVLPIPPLPIVSLGIAFPAAAIATLNAAMKSVQAYFDLLSFDCPLQ